jgi:hypothetical protein
MSLIILMRLFGFMEDSGKIKKSLKKIKLGKSSENLFRLKNKEEIF